MEQFDMKLYGGEVESEYHQTGYSEYTITGIDIDTFSIGGHDLERELTSHIGEFCHFILETDVQLANKSLVLRRNFNEFFDF